MTKLLPDYRDSRMRRNAELVFDPGNQFGALSGCAPYTGLPGWWRRFLFRTLSQRDLAVYVYLLTLMDANDICYPTTEQIREEVGVESPTTIFSALNRLESMGFILRRRQRLPGRLMKFQRNVYQRPAPEFTLLSLLDQKKIDGSLHPLNTRTGEPLIAETTRRSDRAIEIGLRNLLGSKYIGYEEAKDGDKDFVLRVLLQERLDERRAEIGPKAQAIADESKTSGGGIEIDGKRFRVREVAKMEAAAISAELFKDDVGDVEIPF